jgi:2-polyprenyl-6-methoxyphenol hydroxylase-like FAD-dependent oxidoreductase
MDADTDVLVVGAGPVGLAAAIELGMRGVRVLVAERNTRGGSAPRAKTTNVRTRTHLRRWAIADRLAEASPLGVRYPNDVCQTRSRAIASLTSRSLWRRAGPLARLPEHAQWVPQYTLEKVMREHVETLPRVELRFDASFLGAEQDAEGVTAVLESAAGERRPIRARYLIGADGSRSTVREAIGAKLEGRYGLSRHYNVVFRARGWPKRTRTDPR